MAQMNVSFSDAILEELRRIIPRRQRSAFITQAVREKLEIYKQEQAVREAAGSWSGEGRSDPDKELRKLRESWDSRLAPSVEEG